MLNEADLTALWITLKLAGVTLLILLRLGHLHDDLQNNFRAVLQSGLGKLDLVTRREFDVQRQVLERTREKLEAMIRRLDELEGKN